MILFMIALIAALALLGLAADRWGVDSRPSLGEQR